MANRPERPAYHPSEEIEIADDILNLDFIEACSVLTIDGKIYKQGVVKPYSMMDGRKLFAFTKAAQWKEDKLPIVSAGIIEELGNGRLSTCFQLQADGQIIFSQRIWSLEEKPTAYSSNVESDELEQAFSIPTHEEFETFVDVLKRQIEWNRLSDD